MVLRGGLGNQLHQIAAGASVAERHNGKVVIFPHIVDSANNPERRGFFRLIDLDGLFPGIPVKEVNTIERLFLRAWNKKYLPCLDSFIVSEFNFRNLEKKKMFLVCGWFQGFEYLPTCINFSKISNLSKSKPAGLNVHVRLTDFLQNDSNPLDSKYYREALTIASSKLQVLTISCFSDDIPTASKLLPSNFIYNYPEKISQLNPAELLVQLANCEILICSKSTLCWWAANVVQSAGGLVISPFSNSAKSTKWIKISK